MTPDERRTIDELEARYELEPTLRDVYVEGAFDVSVVEEILTTAGCRNAAVYEIDTVDVPGRLLQVRDLPDGNKGRVIAFCLELEGRNFRPGQVTGLADRDYDIITGKIHHSSLLLYTDYSCMEMYFFDRETLQRFLRGFVRRNGNLADRILNLITPVLQVLFFVRAANESLQLGLTWLGTNKQCSVRGKALHFDRDDFVKKYLNKGSQIEQLGAFQIKVQEIEARAETECRCQINGHDFMQLLAKLLHPEVRNKSVADPDVIERAIPAFGDYERLQKAPMFQELIRRVSSH